MIRPPQPPKKLVKLKFFFSPNCPHCHKLLEQGSVFNQVVEEVKRDPSIDFHYELLDVTEPDGKLQADAIGLRFIPAIYLNGEPLEDYNVLLNHDEALKILKGETPIVRKASKPRVSILSRTNLFRRQ